MNDSDRLSRIERILVAVDASPHSLAALEAALKLAGRVEAELIGIYIEDINLIRLSELPFAQEIGRYSALTRRVDIRQMESQLRSQARLARRILRSRAESAHLRWSFRVARGAIPAELLAAALEADMMILGKSGWSQREQLGSTARTIVVDAPGHTLISQTGARLEQPVMVLYDGTSSGEKSLAAAQLLHTGDTPLIVLLLSDERAGAERLQDHIREWSREHEIAVNLIWLAEVEGSQLASLARIESCSILVLPAQISGFDREKLIAFLDQSRCGILLVR